MPADQANITLGTAGHIDHGKTQLIRCLTGCETDRLKEEKERGMSIDLGFAPCTIADAEVGIVDVPGHENFIKTMVAGASGMDGVILVVAADDGVMPQTREHLDILTLLGVRHGIVALTKIDRVEPDLLELVQADVNGFLDGTFLEGAPILPVSNVTGDGFGPFYEALKVLVRSITPRRVDGVFRVPVDRSFSAKGYGTVVAGIPVSGSARVGDEVVLLPQEIGGRIKALQVYGRDADRALAGQCAALNVREWDHRAIQRGHTVTVPGYFSPQEWCVCKLRLLGGDKQSLANGTRVRFHTGTSEMTARIYLFQTDRLAAGDESLVQIRLDQPLLAGPGDPFIVRSLSPVHTIGGGTIIETIPRRLKRNRPEVVRDLTERAQAVATETALVEYCVKTTEGLAVPQADLSQRAKVPRDRLGDILEALIRQEKIIELASGLYVHDETLRDAGERVVNVVSDYHRTSPDSPGMTFEDLLASCDIAKAVLQPLAKRLAEDGRLVERHRRLALPEHRETIGQQGGGLLDAIEALFRERPFHPPDLQEVIEHTQADQEHVERTLKILLEHERLVRVEGGLMFHRDAVDRARQALIDYVHKEGKLESVKFKYLIDTTRKFAIPLLDHFDRTGLTRRVNNTRYLKS